MEKWGEVSASLRRGSLSGKGEVAALRERVSGMGWRMPLVQKPRTVSAMPFALTVYGFCMDGARGIALLRGGCLGGV